LSNNSSLSTTVHVTTDSNIQKNSKINYRLSEVKNFIFSLDYPKILSKILTMQPTIKDLRRQGYKVRVMHARHNNIKHKVSGTALELSARGGSTTIELTTPDKQHTVFGKAVCSLEDNFNKKMGNAIALGRALAALANKYFKNSNTANRSSSFFKILE